MTLRPPYTTDTDPTLPHQVYFFLPQGSSKVNVSCNCLAYIQAPGVLSHHSLGESTDIKISRDLYNDPRNHLKPFGPEDEAKW